MSLAARSWAACCWYLAYTLRRYDTYPSLEPLCGGILRIKNDKRPINEIHVLDVAPLVRALQVFLEEMYHGIWSRNLQVEEMNALWERVGVVFA